MTEAEHREYVASIWSPLEEIKPRTDLDEIPRAVAERHLEAYERQVYLAYWRKKYRRN